MNYFIEWKDQGLHKMFSDCVTGKEIYEAVQETQGDCRFSDIRYFFNDFTRVKTCEVSDRELTKIAAIVQAASLSNPNIRIANVFSNMKMLKVGEDYGRKLKDSCLDCRNFLDLKSAWDWVQPVNTG